MARHTSVRQRPSADDHDEFVASVLAATDWTRRHSRLVTSVLAVIVLAIAGVLYMRHYRSALEGKASNELAMIRQTAASGNGTAAVQQLTQFVGKYGGTHAVAEGRVLLAQSLLEQGKGSGAIPVVEPLASQLNDPLGPTAAMLLGAAYESTGQYQQAEATYLSVAEKAPYEFQRREALEGAARLQLQHKNASGAAALYQRILEQIPDTATGRAVYQMRLAQAQAEAQGAQK